LGDNDLLASTSSPQLLDTTKQSPEDAVNNMIDFLDSSRDAKTNTRVNTTSLSILDTDKEDNFEDLMEFMPSSIPTVRRIEKQNLISDNSIAGEKVTQVRAPTQTTSGFVSTSNSLQQPSSPSHSPINKSRESR